MTRANRIILLNGLLLMLLALPVRAQSVDELVKRYGPPDENGAYKIRSRSQMTVLSENGRAREMHIDSVFDSQTSEKAIHDQVYEIIDELAPQEKRGKRLSQATFSSSCISIGSDKYENVVISRTQSCETVNGENVIKHRTVIRWQVLPKSVP
jgi:hypothetical protein